MSDCGWISVDDYLPDPNVWVQVFEDDNENAQDAYLGKLFGAFRYRSTPAMLLSIWATKKIAPFG